MPIGLSAGELIVLDWDKTMDLAHSGNLNWNHLISKGTYFDHYKKEKWKEFFPKWGIQYFGIKNLQYNQIDSNFQDYRITLQQLLYDGGESIRINQIAEYNQLIYKSETKMFWNRLKFDIARLYLKCLLQQFKVSQFYLQEQKIKFLIQKQDIQDKYHSPDPKEILELEIKSRNWEYQKLKIKRELDDSILQLKETLNLPIDSEIRFRESLIDDLYWDITWTNKLQNELIYTRPELVRIDSQIHKRHLENESIENAWKPRLSLGAYMGKNKQGEQGVLNDSLGVNFQFSFNLLGSQIQSFHQVGEQKNENAIQRIQGFGNQIVGPGENSFSTLGIQQQDHLAVSKKILEGELNLNESKKEKEKWIKDQEIDLIRIQKKNEEFQEELFLQEKKIELLFRKNQIAFLKFKNNTLSKIDLLEEFNQYNIQSYQYLESLQQLITNKIYFYYIYDLEEDGLSTILSSGKGNTILKIFSNKGELE